MKRVRSALGIGAAALLLGTAAAAQDVRIESRPETEGGAERIMVPGPDPVPDRPVDHNIHPAAPGPMVRHEPAFFADLSRKTEGGRFGVSGWTAPNTPVGPGGSGYRDDPGWFAMGLTFTWDGPPPTPARRPVPAR